MTATLENTPLAPSISNQWEYFEFRVKYNNDKRKQIEGFYKLFEDRVDLEDQYFKGLEKLTNSFEQLSLQGSLQDALKSIVIGQREKVSLGRSHSLLVRKEVLEPMKDMMKKQYAEMKDWTSEEKKMEKEYKNYIERIEKLKNEYMSQAKECDAVGLETQSMLVGNSVSEDERVKATQKYFEAQNSRMEKERVYQGKIHEYNLFLERFQEQLEVMNESFVNQELQANESMQAALVKLLDYEKVQAFGYEQNVVPVCKFLEEINLEKETRVVPEDFAVTKDFPSVITAVEYQSFFEEALTELREGTDPSEEEFLTKFRKHYEGVINEEKKESYGSFEHEQLSEEDQECVNFVAMLISAAWKGKNVTNERMFKVQKLMGIRQYRNIVVACLQQYRLAGKFILNLDGFRNIKTILYYLLDECHDSKDIVNALKVMILSLTFWKISKSKEGIEEKKYLQFGIQYHSIWKDLEFWSTANFLSLYQELMKKRSANEGQIEFEKDSHERQNIVVYNQLLSSAYNMISFGVEKSDIKKMTKQFYNYYNLDEVRVKELMNVIDNLNKEMDNANKESGKGKKEEDKNAIGSIRSFFGRRNSTSPPLSVIENRNE